MNIHDCSRGKLRLISCLHAIEMRGKEEGGRSALVLTSMDSGSTTAAEMHGIPDCDHSHCATAFATALEGQHGHELCPVCAVHTYVERTGSLRKTDQLFVSWAGSHRAKPVTKHVRFGAVEPSGRRCWKPCYRLSLLSSQLPSTVAPPPSVTQVSQNIPLEPSKMIGLIWNRQISRLSHSLLGRGNNKMQE